MLAGNTDNAWMETVAMHFHLPEALATAIPLRRSTDDEVGGVQWMEIGERNPLYCALYAGLPTRCSARRAVGRRSAVAPSG